jgi:hypothetical protein
MWCGASSHGLLAKRLPVICNLICNNIRLRRLIEPNPVEIAVPQIIRPILGRRVESKSSHFEEHVQPRAKVHRGKVWCHSDLSQSAAAVPSEDVYAASEGGLGCQLENDHAPRARSASVEVRWWRADSCDRQPSWPGVVGGPQEDQAPPGRRETAARRDYRRCRVPGPIADISISGIHFALSASAASASARRRCARCHPGAQDAAQTRSGPNTRGSDRYAAEKKKRGGDLLSASR